MSNNKQSSVEILEDFLLQHCNPSVCDIEWADLKTILLEAKAMHKEEIMNAHGEEQSYLEDDGSWTRQTAEQYYNETFNTKECYHKGKYTYNKETFECHKCGLIVPNEYRFNTEEK